MTDNSTKQCHYCGISIPAEAVICVHCGNQVEEVKVAPQNNTTVINNINITNNNVITNNPPATTAPATTTTTTTTTTPPATTYTPPKTTTYTPPTTTYTPPTTTYTPPTNTYTPPTTTYTPPTNTTVTNKKIKNKWIAILLCLTLGVVGGHKFYEGKIFMGIVYLCSYGLFGIGIFCDLIALLTKPTYYVV